MIKMEKNKAKQLEELTKPLQKVIKKEGFTRKELKKIIKKI